jgi:hypothetical protein
MFGARESLNPAVAAVTPGDAGEGRPWVGQRKSCHCFSPPPGQKPEGCAKAAFKSTPCFFALKALQIMACITFTFFINRKLVKKDMRKAATIIISLVLTSCATITNGPVQEVRISSTPPGAVLVIDGEQEGVTPMVVHLYRRLDHEFRIEKSGYITNTGELESHFRFAKWLFGNLFSFPALGHVIDLAVGSSNTLKPEEVSVELSKE